MMSKMPCAICSGIPAVASANTGRDIHFEPPITLLRTNHIESSDDIWECPQCDNVYLWHDDTAFTGSGNNDEEVLTRLSREAGAVVRAVLHRDGRAVESIDVPALIALDEAVRGLVLKNVLAHDRPLARHLVPFFLDAILTHEAKGNSMRERDGVPTWASGFVKSVATGDDAVMVQRELDRRPHPRLADLRATLKRTLCSVCRTISPYSKTRTRRHGLAPPLAALIQLRASETLDAWECPECESMFIWERDGESEEGSLSRLIDYASASLRACVRRTGEVSANDREMVFASDGYRSIKIVLAHAARNDRALVLQFLPAIVMRLAVYRPEWLRDFLIDFVREPKDAAMVLDAIAKSSKTGEMIDAVAVHCRRLHREVGTTLGAELERLRAFVSQDLRGIPFRSMDAILVTDVSPMDFDGQGRPILLSSSLVPPRAYEARFRELLAGGYPWINLSYVGLLDDNALVLVEYPREPPASSGATTSINLSGPSRAAEAMGWDARPHIVLRVR